MAENEVVRITAKLSPIPTKCTFEVDRVLFADGSAYFNDAAGSEGSSVPAALFALSGVKQVVINGAVVTVTQDGSAQWAVLAKECGAAIRQAIWSGVPAVKAGFVSEIPADEQIRAKVQKILDFEINPAVASHGGFIELVEVAGDTIKLKMGGGCHGCSSSSATLYQGVAKSIQEKVPEVKNVVDVTDHSTGANPYFH